MGKIDIMQKYRSPRDIVTDDHVDFINWFKVLRGTWTTSHWQIWITRHDSLDWLGAYGWIL